MDTNNRNLQKPLVWLISICLILLTACTSKDEPQPEGPKGETTYLLGWNDSAFSPTEWWLGETARFAYHPDSTIKYFTEDTLQLQADNDPNEKHEFIYLNGRIARVGGWHSVDHYDYVRSVIRYNTSNRISEIDDYTTKFNRTTELFRTRKFSYNALGKLEKMEIWRNSAIEETWKYEWAGNDMITMTFSYSRGGGWVERFTYDTEPSPENRVLGSIVPLVIWNYKEYYMMSEHRVRSMKTIYGPSTTYTTSFSYSYDEKGLPVKRIATWHDESGAIPDRKTTRAYLYARHNK